jgi:uncharacterized membrane-anchored protein
VVETVNDGDQQPKFLKMIGLVAVTVALWILIFFAIGYLFGRAFL